MCHKHTMRITLLLLFSFCTSVTFAELLSYHKFDEGSGTLAVDETGNGNDGTLSDGVEWVEGWQGTAVHLDTANERVVLNEIDPSAENDAMTLMAWAQWEGNGHSITHQGIFGKRQGWDPRTNIKWFWEATPAGNMAFRNGDAAVTVNAALIPYEGEWAHLAVTWNDGDVEQFINAESIGTGTQTFRDTADATVVSIGCVSATNSETWVGALDEAKIFDTALSAEEIALAMTGSANTNAGKPMPAMGESDVDPLTQLSWSPGDYAVSHDVYFGESLADVNDATQADPEFKGNQTGTTYDPGQLMLEETYYWRIDEVNAPAKPATYKGTVWSFEVEPVSFAVPTSAVTATASSSDPANVVNGVGLTGDKHGKNIDTMWLSDPKGDEDHWIQFDLDEIYKLDKIRVWNYNGPDESFLGNGVKDAQIQVTTDGDTWTDLGMIEIEQAPSNNDYTGVDFVLGEIEAKSLRVTVLSAWTAYPTYITQVGLSEVRFYALPMQARLPEPLPGTTGLDVAATLSWRSGRYAEEHQVLMGADPNTLELVDTVDVPHYDASLPYDQTTYWQINEVEADGSVWEGPVWNVATVAYTSVDDMEFYSVDEGEQVFDFWVDGYGVSDNGALVGNDDYGLMETDIVFDGDQSLPYYYGDGAVQNSEIERTWSPAIPLKQNGIIAMSLMFHGDKGNVPGSLYVKINGQEVSTYPSNADLMQPQWHAWTFDLDDSQTTLSSMTIGINGGDGVIFVDAIRLYPKASETIASEVPSDEGLIAYYPFEGNYNDASGNGLNGTPVGEPLLINDAVRGQVLSLDGIDDNVDLGTSNAFNPSGSFSISVWTRPSEFYAQWGHAIISKQGEGTAGWQLRRHASNDNLTFTLRGTVGADDPQGTVSLVPYYDEWIHVAAVYDYAAIEGGQRSVYINGLTDVSIADADPIAASDINTYIGARGDRNGDPGYEDAFFSGMLDELKLYNRALSQGEAMGLAGRSNPLFKRF